MKHCELWVIIAQYAYILVLFRRLGPAPMSCSPLTQEKEWSSDMSASQEKKIRQEQRAQGTEKRQVKKKKEAREHKKHKWIGTAVTVVVVLLAAFLILINTSFFNTNFTAVKIGDVSYSAAEFSYYYYNGYYSLVNTYGDYISQLGLDTSKPLDSQASMSGGTWGDYFRESATSSMQQVTMLWSEAVKEGFELPEKDRASMEESIASIETTYKEAGYSSANKFLEANYGKGVTVELVSKLMERSYIANAYMTSKQASFEYTDSELAAYYTENENDLDNFTYAAYFVDGSVPETTETETTEGEVTAETEAEATGSDVADTGETDAATSDGVDAADGADTEAAAVEAMAAAKAKAQALVDESSDFESFQANVEAAGGTASLSTQAGSNVTGVYADWLKDSARVPGDMTVSEDETGYYVVFFSLRNDNDYLTKNCRHILIKAVASEDGTYTDEAKETAKTKAEELLAQWKAGDATEDSFAELANANSEDTGSNTNGGLYENVHKGQFVTEFDTWLYDSARKAGDTGIVYNDSTVGYHVVYYVGNGENYRQNLADSGKRSADYSAWQTTALESYPISKGMTYGLVK